MSTPNEINANSARHNNTRSIGAVTRKLENEARRGRTPSADLLGRFNDLAVARESLEGALSTSVQRVCHSHDTSSPVAWHTNFVRMKDVFLLLRLEQMYPNATKSPFSTQVRQALTTFFTEAEASLPNLPDRINIARDVDKVRATLWGDLPYSRFKVFQEAFSAPQNFTVPLEQLDRGRLNTCSVSACLVDASLVPNKLLSDLGLVVWPSPRVTPAEALAIKSEPRVINGLKGMWESTYRLHRSNPHILVVCEHTAESRARYGDIAEISPEAEGSILYTRERTSGSTRVAREQARKGVFEPRRVSVSVFGTPYSLLRKTIEENVSYNIEAREVETLATRWTSLNRDFNAEWRADTPEASRTLMKTRLVALIEDSMRVLGTATNIQKAKARSALEKILEAANEAPSRPELVMKNITPILARTVGAINTLRVRSGDIAPRAQWNENDRQALRGCISHHEALFDDLHYPLQRIDKELKHVERAIGQSTNEVEKARLVGEFLNHTGLTLRDFEHVTVRPFRAFAQKLVQLRGAITEALMAGDATRTRDALVKAVVIWKLHQMNHACESLRSMLLPGSALSIPELVLTVDRLSNVLRTRSVLRNHEVPEYAGPFNEVLEWTTTLLRGLRHHARNGVAPEQQVALHVRIRAFLDRQDLESLVRGLSV